MTSGKRDDAIDREWPAIDRTVAHAARVYDYYLGGSAWFAVDRDAAEHAAAVHPGGIDTVRASVHSNRAFLVRVVRWLAREVGVRQFLDIGSGIPNHNSVHSVAQDAAAGTRVVYVDHDPVVLAHAHQLLGDGERGTVDYLQADLRDPASILKHATATLDLADPVAVLLIGVLHFIADDEDPYGLVNQFLAAVPSDSYLAVCHLACDIHPAEMGEVARRFNETTAQRWALRTRDLVRGFFTFGGLELVEPGVAQIDQWRPDDEPGPVWPPEGRTNPLWVGVGRKP